MVDYRHYTYRVTWSEEDDEFLALCTEFPSLSFLADNQSLALKSMSNLVKEVVEDMSENGEKIPEPISERRFSGKFQLRIPPEQHRNLAIKAAEEGVSFNRHISSKLLL